MMHKTFSVVDPPRPHHPTNPRERTVLYILAASLLAGSTFAASSKALDDALPVEVEGGPDASGHLYTWTISNLGRSAIVAVGFPAYNADLFHPPPGWSTDLGDGDENRELKARPGWFLAFADTPYDGIAPGRRDTFSMRIRPRGARRGEGHIAVHFADGAQIDVPGVTVPMGESLGDRYVSLIGLGTIFLIAMVVQAIRSRHKTRSTAKPD